MKNEKEQAEETAVTYTAIGPRNEVGYGKVEAGESVALGDFLSDEAIAHLVHDGRYHCDGELPESVGLILAGLRG